MTTINRYSFWKRFRIYTGVVFLGISFLHFGAHDMATGQSSTEVEDASLLVQALSDQFVSDKNLMSITFMNVNLEEALEILAERLRVGFSYNPDIMPNKMVNFRMTDVPAHEIIYKLLEGTNLEPVLPPSKDVIILKEKIALLEFDIIQETVRGTIVDAQTREVLPGVNIIVEGTMIGTTTDVNGDFELTIPNMQVILIVSYIGYERQEISLDGRTNLDIRLQQSIAAMDDLVVIGYGEQRRRDQTGSVATVRAEQLENLSSTRIDEAIMGRVAGVAVSQNSGQPGGQITVRVRGTNSITASSDPLFVVDGVVGAGDLNTISPDDIETITVLKDASATAIYGARGAGGVIIITTKRGVIDSPPSIRFRSSIGYQQVSKTLDLLNATEYAELVNDTRTAQGLPPVFNNPSSFGIGTDWQNEIFQVAPQQNYSLTVSGGSANTRYMLSGNYLDQDGILIESYFNRGGLRFNLDTDISERVSIGTSVSVSRSQGNPVGGNVVKNALLQPPTNPVIDENGNYVQTPIPNVPSDNPVAEAREIDRKNTTSLVFGNVYGTFAFLDNLELRVSFGGSSRSAESKTYFPSILLTSLAQSGRATVSASSGTEWILENLLTYRNEFGRHAINGLLGYTLQEQRTETMFAGATGFTSDRLGYNNLQGGRDRMAPSSGVDTWGLVSYLFRGNYNFDDRYLLTATARVDGSSKFGADNRYGFFPSGAIAWIVSDESFFDVGLINQLKIRTSYGLTGNEGIGSYVSRARMTGANTALNNINQIGIAVQNVANPDLKWESTAQLDIGLEVTLLNNRLSITADWYDKVTRDLLLNTAIPSQTGFTSALQNVGSVKNTGFELSLNSRNIARGDFIWNSNFNITFNRNEVLELGDEDLIITNTGISQYSNLNSGTIRMIVGQPLGTFTGFVFDGLFQTQEEVDNSHMVGVRIGDERFLDLNGDGAFSDADKTIIGYGQPKFFGGFGNSIYYKSFEMEVFFLYEYGFDILNSTAAGNSTGWGENNEMGFLRDRWTPQNTDTDVPRARFGGHVPRVSDKFIEDGSYLKLQNLTLAYNLPSSIIDSWARNVQVYFTGTNLYTFTGYSGYDPMLNFNAGSNIAYSVDYNPFPTAKIYTLGISVDF